MGGSFTLGIILGSILWVAGLAIYLMVSGRFLSGAILATTGAILAAMILAQFDD